MNATLHLDSVLRHTALWDWAGQLASWAGWLARRALNFRRSPDGSTDIYIGPTAPAGKAGNWIQTVPGKGFFAILRLYNPLQPFFDKTWQPSEIEPT